jgi:chemotaxis protein MotA
MDFTTILGLLLTLGMVFLGLVAQVADLGQIRFFLDPASLLVVLGGSLGSTFMSMPLRSFVQAGSVLAVAFRDRRENLRELLERIVRLSETARRDGILALEPELEGISDRFLRQGLQMAIDGTDPEALTSTLTNELDQSRARHESGRAFLELVARYAPAYGMLGTLIGLILMLAPTAAHAAGVDGAGAQGVPLKGMALALVTTFYGVLLANAVALPLADKLEEKDRDETLRMQTVICGIQSIQLGDNPRVVERKLQAFLPPEARA